MQYKALQQVSVEAVRVFGQLEKLIAVFGQAQVQGGIAKIMMKIEQQHLSAIGTGQQRPHLRNQGSDTASPFCADKSENLGAVAVFLFPAAPPDPRHRIEELFRIKRLEQIFAAATAHSLDNKIRLRLRRHGKDRSIWSVGVNPFR